MKICYFGDYNPEYARNRVIIKGLKKNGVEVLECHTGKKDFAVYWDLYKKHKEIKGKYDILFVANSFNTRLVWFAKLLSDKMIIWDAFYSVYDKYVFDAKVIQPNSLRGYYHWLREWLACRLADVILTENNAYIDFFVETFGADRKKFLRVLIGTDPEKFFPRSNRVNESVSGKDFVVHFHGNFITVQGVPYIILAAKILRQYPEIKFRLIGMGGDYKKAVQIAEESELKNVVFLGSKPHEEIVRFLHQADVSLINFSGTERMQRAIPNKCYESLAAKVAVISSYAAAMEEIFTNRKNILFCRQADPEDLANKILELKNNPELRNEIAQGGYELYKQIAEPKIIGEQLLKDLEIHLDK